MAKTIRRSRELDRNKRLALRAVESPSTSQDNAQLYRIEEEGQEVMQDDPLVMPDD
jgi:TPP-dependent pyruvate/acetoin dehydrogenase alpha subunit